MPDLDEFRKASKRTKAACSALLDFLEGGREQPPDLAGLVERALEDAGGFTSLAEVLSVLDSARERPGLPFEEEPARLFERIEAAQVRPRDPDAWLEKAAKREVRGSFEADVAVRSALRDATLALLTARGSPIGPDELTRHRAKIETLLVETAAALGPRFIERARRDRTSAKRPVELHEDVLELGS